MAEQQGAQPAVTPSGGAFSSTPTRPSNVPLSQQEQAAILRAAGYPGGTIVGGLAVSQPKLGSSPLGNQLIDMGEYQVSIQDAQGRNIGPVTVTKNKPDEQGNVTWALSDVPKTPTTSQNAPMDYAVKTAENGVWYPDDINNPAGGYHLIVPAGVKNLDEEIKKAVDRQVAEGNRNAKTRNEQTTGLYVDDDTLAQIRHLEATDKVAADTLKQRIANETAKQKNEDAQQANLDKKYADDLLTAAAGRTLTGAQATQVTQATDIAKQKLPGELEQAAATLAATKQNTQIAAAPTLQGGVTGPVLTKTNPLTGAVDQSQINLAFEPKTQAQVAGRVGQIQALMAQKGQEIQGKVDRNEITAEQGLQQFNAWYDQNVTPQAGALQAAQETAAAEQARLEAATRTASLNQAQSAAAQAVNVAQTGAGMNYLNQATSAMGGSGMPNWEALNKVQFQTPDLKQTAQQATMEALKYIDPRAAAATGAPQPNLQGLDVNSMLDRTRYLPSGAAALPPPGAPGAPAPGPPQQMAGGGVNGTGAPIGANPMAAAMARMFTPPAPAPEAPAPAPPPAPVAAAPQPRLPVTGWGGAPGFDQPNVAPNPTPGFGFDPSAMAGRGSVPGFGFDPTNIALQQYPPALPLSTQNWNPWEMAPPYQPAYR